MVAHPYPRLADHPRRAHLWRLTLAAAIAAAACGADLASKAAVLAANHGAFGMDAPSSLLRPIATLLIGLLALGGAVLLPWLCVPGAVLVFGGAASNIASLALWQAVPNPFAARLAGGILHFNLADLCVWSGGLLFLAAALWTIWRMPAERFA